MAMVLACASMQFSTNSAIALSGLLCERAMIRIAFQSSPIRSLPLSDSSGLAVLLFAIVTIIRCVECNSGTSGLSLHQATHYTDGLNAGQGAAPTSSPSAVHAGCLRTAHEVSLARTPWPTPAL